MKTIPQKYLFSNNGSTKFSQTLRLLVRVFMQHILHILLRELIWFNRYNSLNLSSLLKWTWSCIVSESIFSLTVLIIFGMSLIWAFQHCVPSMTLHWILFWWIYCYFYAQHYGSMVYAVMCPLVHLTVTHQYCLKTVNVESWKQYQGL